MNIKRIWTAVVVLGFLAVANPALAQLAKDYLGVPGPIRFDGQEFSLVWSSNPSPIYFKHEYLPAGQTLQSYQEMFMIEAVTTGVAPQQVAASQVEGLKQRKSTDPLANYEVISNDPSEVVLDFLISDSSTGTLIVEWNAYRYTKLGEGIALYAISRRAYGDKAEAFMKSLSQIRSGSTKALVEMPLPALQPAN